jgi:tricorn protease
VQTAGGVISTGSTQIMDLGRLRLPFRAWFLLNDGEDMELNGCVPHHTVWPKPGEWPAGVDTQLAKGVEVLLSDVAEWKKQPKPKLRYSSER